ncbi:Sodium-coupled monocarboxylate transporter 2 [Armadillidium vulgare]|nr:Sodium-coupled monocarboxylate transporter 2 [Armadillidium vulgare]
MIMNPSPFVRHTFINTVAMGFFNYLPLYSSDQINFQRICTVKSIKKAQRVISYNVFGIFFIYCLIFFAGLVAYANYAGCDPMALGIIKRKEQIIPYFVMDKLSFIPGLPGIFVATLVGGSLSSISTLINVLILWISLGSFLYKKPQKFLSFSSDECDYSNFTSENTRNQKSDETSPKFICPYVRKFYWSEEEISLLEKEKEDKPLSCNRNVDENHFEEELVNLQNSNDC